jgi:hypothetical protein
MGMDYHNWFCSHDFHRSHSCSSFVLFHKTENNYTPRLRAATIFTAASATIPAARQQNLLAMWTLSGRQQ